jgi:hypothetical protein
VLGGELDVAPAALAVGRLVLDAEIRQLDSAVPERQVELLGELMSCVGTRSTLPDSGVLGAAVVSPRRSTERLGMWLMVVAARES